MISVVWLEILQQTADAHIEAGLEQDVAQRRHALQVEHVAGVALGDQQHSRGGGAYPFHRGLHRLDAQGDEGGIEIVEARGKQIGVHRRQLEAGVAQVDRAIERRRGLQPLITKPSLDGRLARQQVLLNGEQRPGERGGEMGYGV